MNRKYIEYRDKQILANSLGPDQTAPKEQSDQGLHGLPFSLHLLDTLQQLKTRLFNFRKSTFTF